MKVLTSILLVLFCIGCSNSDSEEMEYPTNLSEANVSRITERLQVMIINHEKEAYDEIRKLITDSVLGLIQTRIIYDEKGKAIFIDRGTALGFIAYSLYPQKGYLPFEESNPNYYNYMCKINENYIIDIANPKPGRIEYEQGIDLVTDTIRDFVIIPKDKIILSKDDYKLLQKAKKGFNKTGHNKMGGKRYILYRYE
jgi:hypothetical protein